MGMLRLVGMIAVGVSMPGWFQTGPDSEPVLTVQGMGEIRVAPDLATVRVGIVEQADTAREAQRRVNEVAGRILEALGALDVEEEQIQTARLTLSPVYSPARPEPGEPPQIVAYRASNNVSVRLGDLDRIGPVIDAALDSGANQLEGVSFGLENDREAREEALRAAVNDARRKAEAMADALDVDLDRILSVTEGAVLTQAPFEMTRAAAFQEGVSTPVSAGQVGLSASVTIEYSISQD